MKRLTLALVFVPAVLACASLTSQGAQVKVYQAELAERDAVAPALPDGCKRLGGSGPIEQQQEDREISDPYLTERNRTGSLGGNVLYVQSYRFRNLAKLDCPVGDTSPGCMDRSQSWYRVSFESYACDAPALQALAEAPLPSSPSVFRFELVKKTKTPPPVAPAAAVAAAPTPAPMRPPNAASPSSNAAALKAQVLALMQEGVGADVIRLYVRSHPLAAPLTADEIIDWKRSGISDTIIEATFSR